MRSVRLVAVVLAVTMVAVQLVSSPEAGAGGNVVVIGFDDRQAPAPGAGPAERLTDQYEDRGVTMNRPAVLDYESADPGFPRSPRNAITQCYGEEFCDRPFRFTFSRRQHRARVWLGYDGTLEQRATVVARAFDSDEQVVAESRTTIGPGDRVFVRTELELQAEATMIAWVDVEFASRPIRGLVIDDLEFARRSPATTNTTSPAQPTARVRPDPLRFGSVEMDSAPVRRRATVTNTGDGTLRVETVDIVGEHDDDFEIARDECSGTAQEPGSSCGIDVRFQPGGLGTRTGLLRIRTNASDSPHSVRLLGEGSTGPQPAAELAPEPLDLGARGLASGTSGTVTVTSAGNARLAVRSVTVDGSNADDFTVSDDACTGRTMERTEECAIVITFTPSAAGAREAELLVVTNAADSPHRVELSGEGLDSSVTTDAGLGPPGFVAMVEGSGFPALTPVELRWTPGLGTAVVTTDEAGTFEAALLVLYNEHVGPREIVATAEVEAGDVDDAAPATATTEFLVVPGSGQPRQFAVRR